MFKVFIGLLFVSSTVFGAEANFSDFQGLLSKFVKEKSLEGGGYETSFDYDEALKDPTTKAAVQNQLNILNAFNTSTLASKEEANAFWINSYNFLMIAKIFKDGTRGTRLKINSVKDMGSLLSPYAAFSAKDFRVNGVLMSLDDIEKGTLLGANFKAKGWKDARIHFAVNCASVGCPPLIPQIYTAANVDALLTENTSKAFLTKRHLNLEGGVLRLTSLFDWYASDFIEDSGSIKAFIAKYINQTGLRAEVEKARIGSFISYDWNLNKPSNF